MSQDLSEETIYRLPKNEMELEAEFKKSEVVHELMKKVWGFDFASPIEEGLTKTKDFKVLDVGCGGSGTWLLQLSKDYPLSKFFGLDILPVFPKDFSQSNLQFIQGDILKGLPFEDNYFDFVHMRFLLDAFTEKQWEEKVIKELIRVCKPGGWIELLEIDVDGKSLGPISKRLITSAISQLEVKGINGLISEEITEFFESTNQVDTVYADERISSIGNWGGDIGKLALEFFDIVLHEDDLLNWLEVSREEYDIMIDQYKKEVEHFHSYYTSLRFYCQKL